MFSRSNSCLATRNTIDTPRFSANRALGAYNAIGTRLFFFTATHSSS